MKTIVVVCVFMLGISVYSQNHNQDYRGRVGINTTEPKATLDISKKSGLPESHVQGVSFPNLTTEERNKFIGVQSGIMIYNTDKQCIEVYGDGTNDWKCIVEESSLTVSLEDVVVYVPSLKYSGADYQGRIDNNSHKIKVKIPYFGGQGSYKESRISQESVEGEDGNKKTLTLKISAKNFQGQESGILEGEIEVEGNGEYLVKKMSSGKTLRIVSFYLRSGSGVSRVELRSFGGIADRCFNKSTKECWNNPNLSHELEHQFVYLPIEGPDGKIWLNNNLGADYSNVNSFHFNPLNHAISGDDYRSYGSLFQWQRPSDGHELVNWRSSTAVNREYGSSSTVSNDSNWRANDNRFITNDSSPYSWVNPTINSSQSNNNLWQSNGSNNPCPVGYHVPTLLELNNLYSALTSNNQDWSNSDFLLPLPGIHQIDNTIISSRLRGSYWSSQSVNNNVNNNSWAMDLIIGRRSGMNIRGLRVQGLSVRCIKD